jgi:ATP-dependent Clp protease adaptor protein ClpS
MSSADSSPQPRAGQKAPQAPLPPASLPPPLEPPAPAPAPEDQRSKASPRCDKLPAYKVLLHNDAGNDMVFVVESICDLTPLSAQRAAAVMLEAHRSGVALMLTTHRERAELYVEQFKSRNLTVSMEPVA